MLIKYNRACCCMWVYVLVLHLGRIEGSYCGLEDHDALRCCKWLSTFLRNMLPPFSTLKMDYTVFTLSLHNHLQEFTMSLIVSKVRIFNTVKTSAGTGFDPWSSQTLNTSNVTVFWTVFCWKVTGVLVEPCVVTLSVEYCICLLFCMCVWNLVVQTEKHRLRVLEDRVPRKIFEPNRDDETWDWRRLHND
jgi:hypothetical protein